MWGNYTLLPAHTLDLSASAPCGWMGKLNTWLSPEAELLYRSGQKQNWGREWTSVQAGLSKSLVPTLMVSVGTDSVCSVETELLYKLCFLLPTFPISFLTLFWTILRSSIFLPNFQWKYITPLTLVFLSQLMSWLLNFQKLCELIVQHRHYLKIKL